MRIVPAAASPLSARGHASPTAIVCAALMLALVFLVLRIAGVLGSTFPDCSSIGDSVDRSCPISEIRAG